MTLATNVFLTPEARCLPCQVNFVGSGLVTAEMFRARHEEIVHNPKREQDIKNAGRSTRRKIAEQQAKSAERESKRMARQAAAAAVKSAARARANAAAVKRARVRRRK